MILALILGCLTPDSFFRERMEASCALAMECSPTYTPPSCEPEALAAITHECPGGFDADLAAACLDSYDGTQTCEDPTLGLECDIAAICR